LIRKSTLLSVFLLFLSITIQSQSKFSFFGVNDKEVDVRFKLINNLIVIPIELNGQNVSFILDTGVDKTIIFNLSQNDSIGLNNVKRINLQGLGDGESLEALLSKNNTMKLKTFVSNSEDVYVILKDKFDVSGKMGVTVHGIIGHKIFKDAIVYINYTTKRLTLYNPKYYKPKKCRKCQDFPLQFYRNKPYINAKVQLDTVGKKQTDVKLLIDTGGSEAVWLFENTKEEIKTPINHFRDILGEGLSGTIYGNKSRIKGITMGRFHIKNPTVSFLDSASTYYARQFKQRNGSIGGNILKRFKVWVDYPNKKITLKKYGSFSGGFEYNMSGLDVVYNGKVLVKEVSATKFSDAYSNGSSKTTSNNTIVLATSYIYRFKPSYRIKHILPNSPADIAGLKPNDIILSINGVKVHEYTLRELLSKFQTGHNRRIRMKVERQGEELKFQFRLVKKI
jgi:predicted aspartyl protease